MFVGSLLVASLYREIPSKGMFHFGNQPSSLSTVILQSHVSMSTCISIFYRLFVFPPICVCIRLTH